MKKINLLLLVFVMQLTYANLCIGQESPSHSKWSFGTSISGGNSISNELSTNNINSYGICIWGIDLYHNRIQTSLYSQGGWNSKNTMFNYGILTGYNLTDKSILQITPLLGFGIMNHSNDYNLKSTPISSIGVNVDLEFLNNKKSKRNDIWMIRLHYNYSLPLKDCNIVNIHNITIGMVVRGVK